MDSTGHGTMMVKTFIRNLSSDKYCIEVWKTYKGSSSVESYAAALHLLISSKPEAIVIALEDSSHYLAEPEWLIKISKHSYVFVSAGNGNLDLNRSCTVFPACLSSRINSSRFMVVGSKNERFNRNGPINLRSDDGIALDGKFYQGTSVSTAIASAEFLSGLDVNP